MQPAHRPKLQQRKAAPQREAAAQAKPPTRTAAAPPRRAQGSAKTAPAEPQPAVNLMPLAPFTLSEADEQLLNQILAKWEQQSDKVKTFKCTFTRWEIRPHVRPGKERLHDLRIARRHQIPSARSGRVSGRGIHPLGREKAGLCHRRPNGAEHWICDGTAIFEFDYKSKQLKVRKLPKELQGKAISDGPLPFIFGAKAEQLKRRYWMRDVTPKDDVGKRVWLDARPKFQQDAANFQRATVILNEGKFLPEALQIYPPGIAPVAGKPQAYTAYGFASSQVNDPLAIVKGDFLPPMTPPFWRRVELDETAEQPDGPAPPAAESKQAQRPAAGGPAQVVTPQRPTKTTT